MQILQSLLSELSAQNGNPGGVATRLAETGDQPASDGVGTCREYNRNSSGRGYHGPYPGRATADKNDRDLASDQIGSHRRHPIEVTVGPAGFNNDVAALDEPRLGKATAKSVRAICPLSRRHGV